MEQEQTPKQVQPEDTKTISIEERDAKRQFNSGSRGMDATVHDIDSTRRSVDLASSSNVDDPQASQSSFVHRAQEDDGANQERQPLSQSYESHQPTGKQELDSIGDPYALLLAGLVERERVLRVEEENMQNFFYLQETLVFNKTAASIREGDARRRLTSSIPGMSLPSFPSGSTTTPVPLSPPTIILEPMSTSKDHISGEDHRVPVWTSSSEVGHDFSEGSYELPETKFAKELKDEIGELTEEEHEEMSGWLEYYLLTDLKEKMKHKATEVREKRTRKTLKGKSKVEFHKNLSDDCEEEILETDDPLLSKVLQRIDRMNEKISKTSEDVRRMPTSSRSPPTKSAFVRRESSAFATLTDVCGGVNKYEWSDDSEDDKTNALKMEIPPFDGRNVEKYAEKFGRYLVLTGKTKAKDRVKANLIVQGIKDPELQERVSKLLKLATSFEDFLKKLQDLYPTPEMDLSILGEISKVSHLPYDPNPEQVVKLLETLERLLDKLNPGVVTEERKLMEPSSKGNDKLFVEWTKDDKLFCKDALLWFIEGSHEGARTTFCRV